VERSHAAPPRPLDEQTATPAQEKSAQLLALLEDDTLDDARRVELVGQQLELGWPHALAVSPEDLALYRAHHAPPNLWWLRAWAVLAALLCLSLVNLLEAGPLSVVCAAGVAHACGAVLARREQTLSALAGTGLLAPIGAALFGAAVPWLVVPLLLLTAPMVVTALLSGIAVGAVHGREA
jgi:hypothetical protein